MPEQLEKPSTTKVATLGMGCFWAGDALFGATVGVVQTVVGYAGGFKPSPTYKNIGDHTEVISIEFDPRVISFSQLLSLFWDNHEYGLTTKIKKQYASLILYHSEEQKKIAQESRDYEQKVRKEVLTTEIRKFEIFYPAEDYHQKYRLQKHPVLMESLGLKLHNLQTSSLATKLNGYVAGVGSIEDLENEAVCKTLNDTEFQYVKKCVEENRGTGLYC